MSLLKERNRDCSDLLKNGRGNLRTRRLKNTHLPIVVLNLGKPVAVRNPSQVAAENVNSERGRHEERTDPEPPVTMNTLPVRAGLGFTAVAAVSFMIVLASGHFFSIAGSYSPRRAARLQQAR